MSRNPCKFWPRSPSSEAAGGAAFGATASSYQVGADGSLTVISAAVRVDGTAACWLVVTQDGRFAYTTDTPSHLLSTFAIGFDGEPSLQTTTFTGEGTAPLDAALTNNSRFVYALNSGDGTLSGFRIREKGELEPIELEISGLDGANGLIAR